MEPTESTARCVLEKWERRRLGEEAFGGRTTGGPGAREANKNPPSSQGWNKLRSLWSAAMKGKKRGRRPGHRRKGAPESSKSPFAGLGKQKKTPSQHATKPLPTTTVQTEHCLNAEPRRVNKSAALAPFLSDLLRGEILRGPAPRPSVTPLDGAVLIADVTGFTRLTAALSQQGAHGVELLTRCLNSYFTEIIEVIDSFGGDVVKFAGDSLVVAFLETEIDDGERLEMVTGRAVACGVELTTRLGKMRILPNGDVLSAVELTKTQKSQNRRLLRRAVQRTGDGGGKSRVWKLFKSLLARRPSKEDVETPRRTETWSFFSSRRGISSPKSPGSSNPFSPRIGAFRQDTGQKTVWSEEFTLSLKVFVGAGELCIFHVGGELEDTQEDDSTPRWEFFIGDAPHRRLDAYGRRPPIHQISAIDKYAGPGDVIVSKEVLEVVHHLISCTNLEDGAGRVHSVDTRLGRLKNSLASIPHASLALLPRTSQVMSVERMRMYVPDCVRQRVEAGHIDFTSEMRRITLLFIGFPDLSVPRLVEDMCGEDDVEQVQACISSCQRAMNELDGSLLQMRCDEKGFLAVCAFGLGGRSHMQQAVRGVQAALRINELARKTGNKTAIGVTTGDLLCACVGSWSRTEYTVFGDSINSSARLMCKARSGLGDVLCDQETFHRARGKAEFGALEPMPFQAYRVAPLTRATRERRRPAFSPLDVPLVGRQEVIGNIVETLLEIVHVSGGVILIEGEPGMGKTRIVREVEREYFAARSEEWANIHDHMHLFCGAGSRNQKSHDLFPWKHVLEELFLVDKQARREGQVPPLARLIEERIEQYEDYWRHVLAEALDLPLESLPSSSPATGGRPGLVNWTTTGSTISSQEIDEQDWEHTASSGSHTPNPKRSPLEEDNFDDTNETIVDCGEGHLPNLDLAETRFDPDPRTRYQLDISPKCPAAVEESVWKQKKKPPPREVISFTKEDKTSGDPPTGRTVTFGNTKSCTYSPDSYMTTTRESTPGTSLCDTSSWRAIQTEQSIVEIFQCFLKQYGPCIVVLEDLHHFDVASWSLLAALETDVGPSGLLVIGTLRPNEGSLVQASKSQQVVYRSAMKHYKSIRDSFSTTCLSLPPLNPWETHSFMEHLAGGQTIPDDVVVSVLEKSGGVPIYVQQLTQYLMETGLIAGNGGSVGDTLNGEATIADFVRNTVSIHQLLMDQIDNLSSTAHLTLKVAAVIGMDITAEVVTEVYPYNTFQYDVEMDMVELEGVGFIARHEEGKESHQAQRWRFNNQVARDAVYGLIPHGQRRCLHAKLAQVLQEGNERNDFLVVAFHWEKSSEGAEASEWRRTLKAVSGWQRAALFARDRGDRAQALDCFQRSVDLQEKLIEFYTQNEEPLHSKVSKLLAESAEATPLTPRNSLPDGISFETERSSHLPDLPYVAVVDRVRIQRWMAELEMELAELEPDSVRKMEIFHAAREHLMIGLDLLGAPCPEELIAKKRGRKGLWAKLKGGLRIGKSVLRIARQWVSSSSRKGSYGMPRTPRRRRKSMTPYLLGETSQLQRRMTEEELLEAARIMEMYVVIAVATSNRCAVVHCTDLLDFFVKDRVGQSYFARVAERLNTEGREVLLPRLMSEHSKRGNAAKSPTVMVGEVSRFGSVCESRSASAPRRRA